MAYGSVTSWFLRSWWNSPITTIKDTGGANKRIHVRSRRIYGASHGQAKPQKTCRGDSQPCSRPCLHPPGRASQSALTASSLFCQDFACLWPVFATPAFLLPLSFTNGVTAAASSKPSSCPRVATTMAKTTTSKGLLGTAFQISLHCQQVAKLVQSFSRERSVLLRRSGRTSIKRRPANPGKNDGAFAAAAADQPNEREI